MYFSYSAGSEPINHIFGKFGIGRIDQLKSANISET